MVQLLPPAPCKPSHWRTSNSAYGDFYVRVPAECTNNNNNKGVGAEASSSSISISKPCSSRSFIVDGSTAIAAAATSTTASTRAAMKEVQDMKATLECLEMKLRCKTPSKADSIVPLTSNSDLAFFSPKEEKCKNSSVNCTWKCNPNDLINKNKYDQIEKHVFQSSHEPIKTKCIQLPKQLIHPKPWSKSCIIREEDNLLLSEIICNEISDPCSSFSSYKGSNKNGSTKSKPNKTLQLNAKQKIKKLKNKSPECSKKFHFSKYYEIFSKGFNLNDIFHGEYQCMYESYLEDIFPRVESHLLSTFENCFATNKIKPPQHKQCLKIRNKKAKDNKFSSDFIVSRNEISSSFGIENFNSKKLNDSKIPSILENKKANLSSYSQSTQTILLKEEDKTNIQQISKKENNLNIQTSSSQPLFFKDEDLKQGDDKSIFKPQSPCEFDKALSPKDQDLEQYDDKILFEHQLLGEFDVPFVLDKKDLEQGNDQNLVKPQLPSEFDNSLGPKHKDLEQIENKSLLNPQLSQEFYKPLYLKNGDLKQYNEEKLLMHQSLGEFNNPIPSSNQDLEERNNRNLLTSQSLGESHNPIYSKNKNLKEDKNKNLLNPHSPLGYNNHLCLVNKNSKQFDDKILIKPQIPREFYKPPCPTHEDLKPQPPHKFDQPTYFRTRHLKQSVEKDVIKSQLICEFGKTLGIRNQNIRQCDNKQSLKPRLLCEFDVFLRKNNYTCDNLPSTSNASMSLDEVKKCENCVDVKCEKRDSSCYLETKFELFRKH